MGLHGQHCSWLMTQTPVADARVDYIAFRIDAKAVNRNGVHEQRTKRRLDQWKTPYTLDPH